MLHPNNTDCSVAKQKFKIINCPSTTKLSSIVALSLSDLKRHTEFGHLNRDDMLTSEQHRCSNEKKKFQLRV